ncbi:acyl-CoA dehydrogenase family protein [Neobacillus sp. NRS-1170]|uniref:acyl-CoA dehydrogenase family protein n=1 Tax=Neobacillus sp. NRS-1170 TaxID=3233898 RepID=UPI003D289359
MNDIREMMMNTAEKVFRDRCTKDLLHDAEKGLWPQGLWDIVEELGFTSLGVEEESGGTGGTLGDAFCVLHLAGKYGVPLPLAETLLGNWLLSKSGMFIEAGPLAIAPINRNDSFHFQKNEEGWLVTGEAQNIPFGRHSKKLIVIGTSEQGVLIAKIDSSQCHFQEGLGISCEPRDNVYMNKIQVSSWDAVPLPGKIHPESLYMCGALTRVALMAGSMERILEMSVNYSMERVQFGKPIAHFQAIQQQLAVLAGEVEAAKTASIYAYESENSEFMEKDIMMAKIRVSQAVGIVTSIAHQIHGAMGITDEYPLHYFTRRLWSWREEFGNESQWANQLGQYVLDKGADSFWSAVLS